MASQHEGASEFSFGCVFAAEQAWLDAHRAPEVHVVAEMQRPRIFSEVAREFDNFVCLNSCMGFSVGFVIGSSSFEFCRSVQKRHGRMCRIGAFPDLLFGVGKDVSMFEPTRKRRNVKVCAVNQGSSSLRELEFGWLQFHS